MLIYNEALFPTEKEYLIQLIRSVLGERVKSRFGADWGGFDVWSLEGKEFEGQFIVIDDSNNVIHFDRFSDENGNIDIDIKEFHANCTEMYSYLKQIKKTLNQLTK